MYFYIAKVNNNKTQIYIKNINKNNKYMYIKNVNNKCICTKDVNSTNIYIYIYRNDVNNNTIHVY